MNSFYSFLNDMPVPVQRILSTDKALDLIARLKKEHGPLLFHQSGGCCDGSQPMCFSVDDFRVGSNDVCLGEIAGCKFYMHNDQFEYWKHTQLTLDVSPGRGSSFSLEIPLGLRFIIHSKVFTEEEYAELEDVARYES